MNPNNNKLPKEPSQQPMPVIDTSQLFQKDAEPVFATSIRKSTFLASKKKLLILVLIPVTLLIFGGLAFAFLGQSDNPESDTTSVVATTDKQKSVDQQIAEANATAEDAADETPSTEDTTTTPSSNTSSGSDSTTGNTSGGGTSGGGTSGGGTSGGGTSGGGTNDNPTGTTTSPKTYNSSYTNSCFSPSNLTIANGDTVRFTNNSNKSMWPASDSHPSHTIYSEFDANGNISSGGTYSFTFTKTGTWDYHDHNKPGCTGTITVN